MPSRELEIVDAVPRAGLRIHRHRSSPERTSEREISPDIDEPTHPEANATIVAAAEGAYPVRNRGSYGVGP
ncbi:hypothetical protein [Methanopyrus kandleri]|uniref:hypothetical protein n=1 Tax=Methanopyrus kandleri TaxID=2320 RepID=UPI0011E52CF2|nr:hypothetical protein [Methanopyrus kandleri]